MKIMLCGDCGDLVAPGLVDMRARWCHCGRHAVWWRDGSLGLISVHDKLFPGRNGGDGGKAWVIGLHNGLLLGAGLIRVGSGTPEDNGVTRAEEVRATLDATPSSYLFKRAESLAVRFTPGVTADSRWDAEVPK